MPTPFSHLLFAQRLLAEVHETDCIDERHLPVLQDELGAFLLGTVAADARVGASLPRETTHFYVYGQEITESPWRSMLRQYPALQTPRTAAQRAFVAGYIGHLAMDEIWSQQMVGPYFVLGDWGSRATRFLMLHIILIYMDERDYPLLESWQVEALERAAPSAWIPFITDSDLAVWQRLIHDQIKSNGITQTLQIFGERVFKTPAELRAILDDPQQMQDVLWRHVPQTTLAAVEVEMYAYACAAIAAYLNETA